MRQPNWYSASLQDLACAWVGLLLLTMTPVFNFPQFEPERGAPVQNASAPN